MTYTAGEAAKKLGMTKDGLRYYEKEGLLPDIQRDPSGNRMYSEADIDWIYLIRCLRDTDMPIARIKKYIFLLMQGGSGSIAERREILAEHQRYIQDKICTYQRLAQLIDKKVSFYDDALDPDNADAKCTDYTTEWEHFRIILGGAKDD